MSVGPGRVASDLTPVCGLMSAARRSSTKNAWPPFDGSGWRAFNKRGPVGQGNPYVPARGARPGGRAARQLGGMGRLTEASMINVKNKPHMMTAQVEVPPREPTGDHRAGPAFGGWALYTKTASRPTATTCSATSASR